MVKERTRCDLKDSRDDATDSSGMPSGPSRSYMRDTTSSSARKTTSPASFNSSLSSRSETALKVPDSVKLQSGTRESERILSASVCSYSYCSLHSHQHQRHASSSPLLKEFIAAKRQQIDNQKDMKLREDVVVRTTSATKKNQSRQKVSVDSITTQTMQLNHEEGRTGGLDFQVTSSPKLRKNWAAKGKPSNDSAVASRKKAQPPGRQQGLNKDLQELHQEEMGTTPVNVKKEPADAIPLPGKAKENGDTVNQSSQLSADVPDSDCLRLDRDPQDISADEYALSTEGLQGNESLNITVVPSAATCTSSDTCWDPSHPTAVNCQDEQGIPTDEIEVTGENIVGKNTLPPEGNCSPQSRTFMDKENYASLWVPLLRRIKTDLREKGEIQLSDDIEAEGNTYTCSEVSPDIIHDKFMNIPAPTSVKSLEDETIKLVEEAINELLISPEQADDNLFSSISVNSEQEASVDSIVDLEDEKASPRENLPKNCNKLSKAVLCKRFIQAMKKMQQLKLKSPPEIPCIINSEAYGTPSLNPTQTGEKKSWQEWMLDYALQQVVANLAPARRKRVALLVQAFEIVSSQPKTTSGKRG